MTKFRVKIVEIVSYNNKIRFPDAYTCSNGPWKKICNKSIYVILKKLNRLRWFCRSTQILSTHYTFSCWRFTSKETMKIMVCLITPCYVVYQEGLISLTPDHVSTCTFAKLYPSTNTLFNKISLKIPSME